MATRSGVNGPGLRRYSFRSSASAVASAHRPSALLSTRAESARTSRSSAWVGTVPGPATDSALISEGSMAENPAGGKPSRASPRKQIEKIAIGGLRDVGGLRVLDRHERLANRERAVLGLGE